MFVVCRYVPTNAKIKPMPLADKQVVFLQYNLSKHSLKM